ncbi:MAG: VCBS repeat-containing protein [Phycisphaerae bacterium]|nr:VCBS repeat-containing protein [Phycisphaerae bacterium]
MTRTVAKLLGGLLICLAAGAGPGCSAIYLVFGPGGLWPAGGTITGPTGGTINPGSGGAQGPGGTIPTTTQPAPVAGPSYTVSLLDDLFEQTSGARMVLRTDLDGDSITDFATISSESEVVLLHFRNPTTSRFEQLSIAGGLPLTRMVRVRDADFDQDGNPDLVVAINDTGLAPPPGAQKVGTVVLLFAPADPRDQLAWVGVPLANAFRANDNLSITDLVVADFDNVNGPDIAFVSNEPPPAGVMTPLRFVFFFLNPGPANARDGAAWGIPRPSVFGNQPPFVEVDAPDVNQIFAADIDQDSDTDLLVSFPPAHSLNIRWLENPGPANIDPNPAAALPRWNRHFVGQQDGGANAVAVGDIDADGDLDVAASTNVQGLTQWFQNPGVPAVGLQSFPWLVYPVGTVSGGNISQLHLADLNNDGRQDVWLAAGGTMRGFFPRSGASFFDYWTPFTIANTNPVADIGVPAFVDLDGNGTTDFVVPIDRIGLTQDQFIIFTRN